METQGKRPILALPYLRHTQMITTLLDQTDLKKDTYGPRAALLGETSESYIAVCSEGLAVPTNLALPQKNSFALHQQVKYTCRAMDSLTTAG